MSHPGDAEHPASKVAELEVSDLTIVPDAGDVAARSGVQRKTLHAPLSPLPIVAGILVLVVGSAFALFSQRDTTDPHFAQAKVVLERYELGKPEEARDYGHPAYAEALGELELVDHASQSARPAGELAADIRRRAAEQEARARARAVEMKAHQELQQRRDEQFFRERRMRPPPPSSSAAPECVEDATKPPLEGKQPHKH